MIVKPVILCGGSGTRLWPLSTPDKPKQFQALTSSDSMIELTYNRLRERQLEGLEIAQPLVVGSTKHESLLREQMQGAKLILEPVGRNSAPAVAAACLLSEPDEYLLILPADHHIGRPDRFLDAIVTGLNAAQTGSLVTFGIRPTHPATGYGYIRGHQDSEEIQQVREFVEKPPLEKAKLYCASDDYFWNAGIFLFKTSSMIAAFERLAPDLIAQTKSAIADPGDRIVRLNPDRFADIRNISIDYAIMEHERDIKVVPVDMEWSDVGGYDALWEMFARDESDNVTFGPAIVDASSGAFVRSDGPLVSVSGLENMAVIANDQVVLVAPRSDADAIKRLGHSAQSHSQAHAVSATTSDKARALLENAFSLWSKSAWDSKNGGFVEYLDMKANPVSTADRRVRVQARQVFSFAQALTLGLNDVAAMKAHVDNGLEYLDTVCRHPHGGWVHQISFDGRHIGKKRDLYDHAFIMLAGAASFKSTKNETALKLAQDALSFIDSELLDATTGGYRDSSDDQENRRANPHMHLLESFLALFDATGDSAYLERASRIVFLFERHFFEPEKNFLIENFQIDWSPAPGEAGHSFEPGHHYEWATLLMLYSQFTGHDSLSWCRRLIATADAKGLNAAHGFAYNQVASNGAVIDQGSRLWHQLEKFRARVYFPGTAVPGEADAFLKSVKACYFDPAEKGAWIDELSARGEVSANNVPASMLYHLVTALAPVLRNAS